MSFPVTVMMSAVAGIRNFIFMGTYYRDVILLVGEKLFRVI